MKTLRVISWNINSVRMRMNLLKDLMKNENPDVILLQETKVADEIFPYQELEDTPYNVAVHGQKAYNGVAVLSKASIDVLQKGFDRDFGKFSGEARFLYVSTSGIEIASLYAPNGQEVGALQYEYKLNFYDEMLSLMREAKKNDFVIGGDFNIAYQDIDVYNPKAWEGKNTCSVPEREKMRMMMDELTFHDVWRDLHQDVAEYSWWDYRFHGFQKNYGLRIDYFMVSDSLNKKVRSSSILKNYRALEKPSDHAPIEVIFEF